jgi:nucleoside-diphosphate-sugar epimerase
VTILETGLGNLLKSDLDHVLNVSEDNFRALQGSRILISGGSGFIGKWLLSCLLHANEVLDLKVSIAVITRNRSKLLSEICFAQEGHLEVLEVDLCNASNLALPSGTYFSHMIHLATPTTKATGSNDMVNLKGATLNGLKLMVELAEKSFSPPTLLHASSGAVYGQQARNKNVIAEYEVERDQVSLSEYGATKLDAEEYVTLSTKNRKILGTSPRLFAFMGPHLSYEDYAIGNFIRDASKSGVIHVKGHPLSRRSYLYPTDLVHLLLQLLVKPVQSPFNVGSNLHITMTELATEIAANLNVKKVLYSFEESTPNHYVPMVETIETKFDFKPTISLTQGIQKWLWWQRIQDLQEFN